MSDPLENFDSKSQQEIRQFVENETGKAKINAIIHDLSDRCWQKCFASVPGNKITTGGLDKTEFACVRDCVGRWVDTSYLIVKSLEKMQ